MNDSPKNKGLRKKLVLELMKKGIKDESVLKSINLIPRHLFLHKDFENFAYVDKPFPIGFEQTISQPYTVAFQTQALEIKAGNKVLEIGSGSGYQTSILVSMKAEVYSIERIYELYKKSKRILSIEKFLTLLIFLFLRRFIKSFLLKNNLLTKSSKSSKKLSVYF